MEYAIFLNNKKSIEKYREQKFPHLPPAWKNGETPRFQRLYFGQEFCDRLIPTSDDLLFALNFAKDNNLSFTLLTPFSSEIGLEKWEKILETLYRESPDNEVVFNDMGVLHLILEKFPRFKKILGRLLTKQKRGPRILRIMGKVPEEMIDHFRRFNADVPKLAKFYREIGIERMELDNALQGINRDSNMPASLYYPYIYVSTTRMCLTNQSNDRQENMRAIFPCKRECHNAHFEIQHQEIPLPVTIAGNTQFIYNDKLPENPSEIFIDRLVYEPQIPI